MSSPSLSDPEFSRLCRLINDSLHPFTESENISLSKEEEKNLLLILSQVSNEIHRLIHTTNTASPLNPYLENHQFLSKAISHLITILTLESRFIQHLAGNVLVTLSEFIALSGKSWDFLIRSLCICFEFSISNISSCSFEPSIGGVEGLLKPKLKNASLFTVAGIIRILRNILKILKEECDDELVQVFLNLIRFGILNVPWDSMDEIFGGNGGEEDELRIVFLGNFIQFLCSLVEQFSFVEGLDDSLDKHLLHEYFQELLCQPLTEVEYHLINPRKDTGMHCPSAILKSGLSFDRIPDMSCYGRKKDSLKKDGNLKI
ncbi:hypothetical protein QQP08_002073 [Theobroma cacao]|nr:hypothetical protein QQP08_002073 [Theobroma cacao]